MNLREIAAIMAASAVIALGLAGCTQDPSVTTAPIPTSPSATPTMPAPSAEPTASAAPVTCVNLLDQASIDDFAAREYTQSDDFAQRAIEQDWPESALVTAGGVLCQWGYPDSDATEFYGRAVLTPDEAVALSTRLATESYTPEPYADGEMLVAPETEYVQLHYFHVGDTWMVGFSPTRIDELRRNSGLV